MNPIHSNEIRDRARNECMAGDFRSLARQLGLYSYILLGHASDIYMQCLCVFIESIYLHVSVVYG